MASKSEIVDFPKNEVPLKEQQLRPTPIVTQEMIEAAYKAVVIKQMQLYDLEQENPEFVRMILVEECIRAALVQRAKQLS